MSTKEEMPSSETDVATATPVQTSATTKEEPKENGQSIAAAKPKEDTASQRVQEGRAYNSRDRRYNNDRNVKDRKNEAHKRHDYQKNIKSDFSSQKETDDPAQIRKQVTSPFRETLRHT